MAQRGTPHHSIPGLSMHHQRSPSNRHCHRIRSHGPSGRVPVHGLARRVEVRVGVCARHAGPGRDGIRGRNGTVWPGEAYDLAGWLSAAVANGMMWARMGGYFVEETGWDGMGWD